MEKKKRLECVDRAIKKYHEKCSIRNIMFYPNEKDRELYDFSKTINFQGEVKKMLKRKMARVKRLAKQNKSDTI